jgi:subfamily B ATP-binding cassette protein MsbA
MGLSVASILLIKEFLSGVIQDSGGLASALADSVGASAALWIVASLLVLTYLGAALMSYDNTVVQQRIVKILELGLMERLIRRMLTLSVLFFDRHSQGDLIQAVRQDVSMVRQSVVSFARMFLDGTLAIGLLVTAVWMSPRLAFWALLVLPLAAFPIILISRQTLQRSHAVRRTGYVLFDVVLQLIRGIRVIKAYHGEQEEAKSAIERARDYFDELIALVRVRALADVALQSLAALGIVAVIIVGGFQVMQGTLGWPSLLAFLMAVRALHGPLNNINNNYMLIQRYGASVQRIGELSNLESDVRDVANPVPLTSAPSLIGFDNVGFTYGDDAVLHGLTFEVKSGETIGIAGPSGVGKSTLLNLVARFYDPTDGSVRFDGRDLREFHLADVYDKLAIVTQEPFLFRTTVRDNIRCGRPNASDADIEDSARAAEIHDEILALPLGYDTVLGVGGRTVSTGQAQRINVARAILKNAPILLLDEATSSLDSIAEAKVQRALDRLIEGRTTFVVSHRLSALRGANRIMVLEDGQCVGFGTHEELNSNCRLYRHMWEVQHLGSGAANDMERKAQ